MATYECSKSGMSVNATCGKCNAPHVDDSLTLENKTLDDILNHKFYHALEMSWASKGTCLSTCRKSCSVEKGLVRSWELNSGKIYKDRRGGAIQSWYEDNSS